MFTNKYLIEDLILNFRKVSKPNLGSNIFLDLITQCFAEVWLPDEVNKTFFKCPPSICLSAHTEYMKERNENPP